MCYIGTARNRRRSLISQAKKACKQKAPAALRVLDDIMRNGESERNRLSAAQTIFDRAYGKAVQATVNQHSGPDGRALFQRTIHEYSDEELAAIIAGQQH